jgi:hypothetical protein
VNRLSRLTSTVLVVAATGGALAAMYSAASVGPVPDAAAQTTCIGALGSIPAPQEKDSRLLFGIFPGGPAGVVAGPRPPAIPEDQARVDAALAELSGGRPFAVHLYTEYVNPVDGEERLQEAEAATAHYASRGFSVEWVIRYRPASAPDVAGYVEFVRDAARRLGAHPAVKALQVTNEANFTLAPDAADGAYAGAVDALVQGVIAAKEEVLGLGRSDLEIGFNWFYRTDPANEERFWSEVAAKGGPAFVDALDWVGLDMYPETFFPPANTSRRSAVVNAMSVLRECLTPIAGIPSSVPIHVTENGWPTAPNRSYEEQERALREMVLAVHEFRGNYNVTDYRWFDLRDSNSSDPNFQQQYGIMRDDYTPKPAFWAYRELIAALGVGAPAGAGGVCEIPIRGTPRRDVLDGTVGSDDVRGGGGRDRIQGRDGDDCLSGGHGRDRVGGNAGADRLEGGRASDRLRGGSGSDRIDATGGGHDDVRCGAGHDVARFDRDDRVRGCERANRRARSSRL